MPEALAILEDFLAEGTAGAEIAAGETAATTGAGDAAAAASPVQVETPAAVETKEKKAAGKKGGFSAAIPALDEIPTPKGGIAIMLCIALLLIFAIVPAPGQHITRLSLIWKAIVGQASLSDGSSGNGSGGSDSGSNDHNGIQGALGGAAWGTLGGLLM